MIWYIYKKLVQIQAEIFLYITHLKLLVFYYIFNEYDASIKKLNNISIDTTGYVLNGTLIGFDLINVDTYDDAVWIYQNSGKLYCRWIKHWSDGGASSGDRNCNANIVYI